MSLFGKMLSGALAAKALDDPHPHQGLAIGFHIVLTMVLCQGRDAATTIVWPTELAPGTPRFPTPPWSQRS